MCTATPRMCVCVLYQCSVCHTGSQYFLCTNKLFVNNSCLFHQPWQWMYNLYTIVYNLYTIRDNFIKTIRLMTLDYIRTTTRYTRMTHVKYPQYNQGDIGITPVKSIRHCLQELCATSHPTSLSMLIDGFLLLHIYVFLWLNRCWWSYIHKYIHK